MRKDIYDTLYITTEGFPLFLWISEEDKKNGDLGWQKICNWLDHLTDQKFPLPGMYTFAAIMNILRDLVENVIEKIESGKETKDVIRVYYLSRFPDISSAERTGRGMEWSSGILEVGANVRETLLMLRDFRRKNPFLSSYIATEIMNHIVVECQSRGKIALRPTGGTPFVPQA